MNESKHTQGEWKVGEVRHSHGQRYREVTAVRESSYLNTICLIASDEDESEPNAHLIASSPKMLAYLKEHKLKMDRLLELIGGSSKSEIREDLVVFIDETENMIYEAEGKD